MELIFFEHNFLITKGNHITVFVESFVLLLLYVQVNDFSVMTGQLHGMLVETCLFFFRP